MPSTGRSFGIPVVQRHPSEEAYPSRETVTLAMRTYSHTPRATPPRSTSAGHPDRRRGGPHGHAAHRVPVPIPGPDSKPVTNYEVEQTKLLHFYVIRNDLTGFPTRAPHPRPGRHLDRATASRLPICSLI